jgi:hypothetical protein
MSHNSGEDFKSGKRKAVLWKTGRLPEQGRESFVEVSGERHSGAGLRCIDGDYVFLGRDAVNMQVYFCG